MENLFTFFLVLFAGVFFSALFRRLHLPWVVALIVGGIIIGSDVLNIIDPQNDILQFLAQVGLIFLMFMAGLETRLSSFKKYEKKVFGIAFLNIVIPFTLGFFIGHYFGFATLESVLLGTLLASSSVAVVMPSLEATGMIQSRVGKSAVTTAIIAEIFSLVVLSILIQITSPTAALPLPLFYLILLASLVALRWLLPKLRFIVSSKVHYEEDIFEEDLRSIFLILIGTVVIFQLLGLHPIIAGFFAGLVLSDTIRSKLTEERLRAISYGLFIPIFFVIVGAQMDLNALYSSMTTLYLVLVIVTGSVIAKFASGWIGAKLSHFNSSQAAFIGAATIPQLSTTLAVAFSGAELNLLNKNLITALIALGVITTFVAPILMKFLGRRELQKYGKNS